MYPEMFVAVVGNSGYMGLVMGRVAGGPKVLQLLAFVGCSLDFSPLVFAQLGMVIFGVGSFGRGLQFDQHGIAVLCFPWVEQFLQLVWLLIYQIEYGRLYDLFELWRQ